MKTPPEDRTARAAARLVRPLEEGLLLLVLGDRGGRVTLASGGALRALPPEALLGRQGAELDRLVPGLAEAVGRALRGERAVVECELGGRAYDLHSLPQEAEEGPGFMVLGLEITHRAGMPGLADDITELKQVERELRQSRADLEAMLESAQDSLWSVDARHRLVAANRAFLLGMHQAFGIEPRPGDNLMELLAPLAPEVASHWAELYDRALRGERVTEEQDYVLQGEQRYFVVSVYPIRAGDSIPGVACFSKDITEHRRLEERLRQSAKLEAIGQLASGVAHDFNNLLTVIFASCELMFRRLPAEAGLHRYLQSIHKAATQAAGLTRQLLAFGRRQPLRPEVLDPNEVMAEQAALCERLLGARIEFSLEMDPTVGRIKMDRSQLQQALLNLALNARDAMPQGGRLTLRTRALAVPVGARTEPPPGRWVVLEVQDTGTGMTAEVQSHVFEPFFTTKEPGKGTGLGLSTTYGIVRQSGGHLQVESTPGVGSTFRLFFPCTEEPLPVEAPASSQAGLL